MLADFARAKTAFDGPAARALAARAAKATSDWRVIARKTHAYFQRKRVQSVQMTHTCQKSTIANTILRRRDVKAVTQRDRYRMSKALKRIKLGRRA